MTFYSELLKSVLCDVIPEQMGKIGWPQKLVKEMIGEIVDKSFDFRKEEKADMHSAVKAVMRACECIENDGDDYPEARYSSGIYKIWEEYESYIAAYLSDNCLFDHMQYTLEDYLLTPKPVQAEMINIVYRAVANEINDYLWNKFFE